MATSRVSVWVASREQVLFSAPLAMQVAAVVTCHALHWWLWAGSGVVPLPGSGSHPVRNRAHSKAKAAIMPKRGYLPLFKWLLGGINVCYLIMLVQVSSFAPFKEMRVENHANGGYIGILA
jgi:hypothetical protein